MKKQNRLIVTISDLKLLRQVELIPKPHRGKVVERALEMYMESSEGSGVFDLFQKESSESKGKQTLKKEGSTKNNLLKKVLGDY